MRIGTGVIVIRIMTTTDANPEDAAGTKESAIIGRGSAANVDAPTTCGVQENS